MGKSYLGGINFTGEGEEVIKEFPDPTNTKRKVVGHEGKKLLDRIQGL